MEITTDNKALLSAQNLARLSATLEKAQTEQAGALVLDFDDAHREYEEQNKPLVIRLGGRLFELPAAPPFSFIVFAQRHCFKRVNGKDVFAPEDAPVLEMIEHVFGREMLDFLEEHPRYDTRFVLDRILPGIMERWGLAASGDVEGKS